MFSVKSMCTFICGFYLDWRLVFIVNVLQLTSDAMLRHWLWQVVHTRAMSPPAGRFVTYMQKQVPEVQYSKPVQIKYIFYVIIKNVYPLKKPGF